MVLAEELLEGCNEVGFNQAREGLGEMGVVVEICGVSSVGSFEGLNGLDCFGA